MLRGVIFSLSDVLVRKGPIDKSLFGETVKLIKFLMKAGITPVFASNHDWYFKDAATGETKRFKEVIEAHVGQIPFYVAEHGDFPYKPQASAVRTILEKHGWTARQALFVGNSDVDMKAARNGKVLFLNAVWHGETNPYGFQFQSPADIARYVDCLCLGLDEWFWALKDGKLEVYALAPFTTLSPSYDHAHAYSADAKATAKSGAGDATFWGRLLAARVYFSGLVDEVDYITAYPGHSPKSGQTVVAEALVILAQSLHKQFLPDLIVRHTTATKSQTARAGGGAVGVENQLNTIQLNPAPLKGPNGEPYKAPPTRSGKTVLVVDDFCTQGNSFEAARAFIEATGAKAISLAWLKTINTDYRAIAGKLAIPKPYDPIQVTKVPTQSYSYKSHIVGHTASVDLADVYARYHKWNWPTGL